MENCNTSERINDRVDHLAKLALLSGYAESKYISSNFPGEDIRIFVGQEKLTGSPKSKILDHWGYKTARAFFDRARIIQSPHFHLVWWDGIGDALSDFPKMYRVWLTKHVSEFCGTNLQHSYWNKNHKSLCPCCNACEESTMHMTRCSSPGRV